MTEFGTGTTVAFLGLGKMGHPMVGRLADAGYPVLAFDVSAAAVRSARPMASVRRTSSRVAMPAAAETGPALKVP